MYCPDCGSQNSAAQRFCRSCGLALEKISQSLAEQRPTNLDESLQQRKEKLEKLGVAAMSVFGVSIVGFIAYILFFKLLASQSTFWAAFITLAVLIVVGCGLLSVILFAKANELKETPANLTTDEPKELRSPKTTQELLNEGRPDPVFSVTDRTTDLLTVKKNGVDN